MSEAIAGLRGELLRAWGASVESGLRFKPSPVELTLEVAITSDKTAHAGVKWWLLEAGGEVTRGLSATHTIKMTLDPVLFDDAGQPVEFLVSDSDEDDDTVGTSESTGGSRAPNLADPE
ncbi:hypothetical protein PU560_07890 [Georgenia sp. 10Sc9-8]|uniref:Trypsin-co-occurring domain-containing protein n=1 Tax=Georgenia halotolerans TaxID=3028317 RepID=A0ABT5TWG1_9MICO|nr:hypothetical protein [Georgenia halotolerans]